MNNSLYLVRNKDAETKINSLVKKYNLELCFEERKEKVLKNENMLVLLKKKYIFIRFLLDSNNLFSEVQQIFESSNGYEK